MSALPVIQSSYSIGMLLLPGFNAVAAMGFLDPFRAANYLSDSNLYRWTFLSLDNKSVYASNELAVASPHAISLDETNFDLIVINASWSPERFQSTVLQQWLQRLAGKGISMAAIDTGAFVLAYAGLLKGYRATVHYEHIAAFRELFADIQLEASLFTEDRGRLCCAGGLATVDMSLEIVQNQNGLEMANAVSTYIFKQRQRTGNEEQDTPSADSSSNVMPKDLSEAIILMERNIEEILTTPDIAKYVGISQRKLQRLFRVYTAYTPVRYYVNLRLDRARGLITQTNMGVAEVAVACGFGSAEQFSRTYKQRFNLSPSQDRVLGRIPFQFRSFPAYIDE